MDPSEKRVLLAPKEHRVKQVPVAIEGQLVLKELRDPLVHQAPKVKGARKVIWVLLVEMASKDLQGLQGSRAKQDYQASSGHQDQKESQVQQGLLENQDSLDLQGIRIATKE